MLVSLSVLVSLVVFSTNKILVINFSWVKVLFYSRCEAGDLAGKFGPLMPNTAFDMVDNSSTLFLNNRYSIVGRSIVIHQHLDSTNFECATIRSVREMGGKSLGGYHLYSSSLCVCVRACVRVRVCVGGWVWVIV